jgi:putative NADH-flavin reductase
MKLIVFGSTGGIGSQVIAQALAAGHTVTAVARNPAAISTQHERLTVVQGDVLKPCTLAEPIAGQEAVISALGVRTRGPTTVYSEGVANIMRAMQVTGVPRLLSVSAIGIDPGPLLQRWLAKPILWRLFKDMYTDLVRMEDEMRRSDFEWTIVRPPRLTNGSRTGQYHMAVNRHLTRGGLISRADVADYMLTHLDDRSCYRAQVEIAY